MRKEKNRRKRANRAEHAYTARGGKQPHRPPVDGYLTLRLARRASTAAAGDGTSSSPLLLVLMAAAKRSHPSHTLSALLFALFPYPPLTLLPFFCLRIQFLYNSVYSRSTVYTPYLDIGKYRTISI